MSAAPHKLPEGIAYPLGIAAGWLYYLGFHAVHAEWAWRGAGPAFASALAGVAGAAVIQRGAEALFRYGSGVSVSRRQGFTAGTPGKTTAKGSTW